MSEKNLQVVPARRLVGAVQENDFRLVESDVPRLRDGEFLVRNHYLSLDPYMQYRETVAESLNGAPAAFIGLLAGKNFGKQLVKLV